MIRKPRKPLAEITPEVKQRPTYTCPELGRTCNRPNAYDAFELPSLYGVVRRPYRFSQD